MTPETWNRIRELFDEAVRLPITERRDFVIRTSDSQEQIESVLALLRQHDTIGFLDRTGPAWLRHVEEEPVFVPGDVLCDRFEVIRFIARGGMGEVYEAHDRKVRELVALKTIRADGRDDNACLDHFALEVGRARKIVSRHVCRVHDLFSDGPTVFLTMELLTGETLADRISKGPMSYAECTTIALQLCQGLAEAHRHGIVHLDLKPSNIMLIEEQAGTRAVITDFGIAHQIRNTPGAYEKPEVAATRGGTPSYMAPEQVNGGSVSPKADIYSLGVVLFEMAAGKKPFESGASKAANIAVEALPSRFRGTWLRTVRRCLSLAPAERFEEVTQVAEALGPGRARIRSLVVASIVLSVLLVFALLYPPSRLFKRNLTASEIRSLVVIPFETVGEGAPDQHIGDGIAEELIHRLTSTRSLRVIARESSFRLIRQGIDPETVAGKFGVDGFIAGSFRRHGNRIRIIARLVSSDGVQVWSRAFDKEADQLAGVQQEIAFTLTKELHVQSAGVGVPLDPPLNPQAHEYALLARLHFNKRTDDGILKAKKYMEDALKLDSRVPDMHFTLATIYLVMAERNFVPPPEAFRLAKESVDHGMARDPDSAEGLALSGYLAALYERRFDRALDLLKAALTRDPDLVIGQQWYAYTLAKLRRFDEAVKHARRAVELDPISVPAHNSLAVVLWYSGDEAATIRECARLLEQESDHGFAHLVPALMLARNGRMQEAWQEYGRSSAQVLATAEGIRTRGELSAIGGDITEALKAAKELQNAHALHRAPASYVAIVYAAANQRDAAFEWLYKAYDEYDGFLPLMNVYPAFAPLRSDRRFAALLAQLGM